MKEVIATEKQEAAKIKELLKKEKERKLVNNGTHAEEGWSEASSGQSDGIQQAHAVKRSEAAKAAEVVGEVKAEAKEATAKKVEA